MLKASAPKSHLFFILPTLLLFAVSLACSGNPESTQNLDAAGDAGAVVFNLSWPDAPSKAANGYVGQKATGDVCVDYDIQWIQARAVDPFGNERSSGKWECARKSGTLTGLPEGSYDVIIQGEVSGIAAWRGEATGVQVLPKQQTDAGVISMVHLHDQTPPVVVNTIPGDGSQSVAVNAALTAKFDSAIVAQSIDADNFILTYNEPGSNVVNVPCEVSYDRQSHTAVLRPLAPLINDTAYTAAVTIDQGGVVEDMAGNIMQQAVEWTFTTYRPDLEGPQIISQSPADGEMDVVLAPIVQVRFSEAINPTTISTSSILLEHNGNIIQSVLGYDDQLSLVTLTPTPGLPAGSTITVVVTTDLLDLAGNPMAAAKSWSFVTQYPAWRTENIDGGMVLSSTRITLEPNDAVHIGASQAPDGAMETFTRGDDNTWAIRTKSVDQGMGLNFDIVINNQDMIYTTRLDPDRNDIFVAMEGPRPAGGVMGMFVKQDNSTTVIQGLRMAATPDGGWDGGAVVFFDAGSSQLRYAAGAIDWEYEVVDAAAIQYPSLAMAAGGVAHISYYDQSNGLLRYAQRNPDGTWDIETVDGGPADVGRYTDIVIDASGNPHISYRDESNTSLKYAARQASGQWWIETVDNSDDVGRGTSIDLDSLGLAHISYQDDSANALKYAARTGTGSWHTHIVDTEDSNGYGSAIAVDSQDYAHISYCYAVNMTPYNQLRYATTRPSN